MSTTLKEAMALNSTTNLTSFSQLISSCKNPSFFSSSEPIEWLSSWEGYYYTSTINVSSVSLSTSTIAATGGQITVTYYIYNSTNNVYVSGVTPSITTTLGDVSNITATDSYGKGTANITVYSLGGVPKQATTATVSVSYGNTKSVTFTQNENALISSTGGQWVYNWTTTNNSTRTRVVTNQYTAGTSTSTETETGGKRYIVLDSFSDGLAEASTHTFSASGGEITARTLSHDYWTDSVNGKQLIQAVEITGVSVSCSGFTCIVQGSEVRFIADNLGCVATSAKTSSLSSKKDGFTERKDGKLSQNANIADAYSEITSYGMPSLTIGQGISAAGGSSAITASATNLRSYYYSSGCKGRDVEENATISLQIQDQYFWNEISEDPDGLSRKHPITRYNISNNILYHDSMDVNNGYDYCVIRACNSLNSSLFTERTVYVKNNVTSSNIIVNDVWSNASSHMIECMYPDSFTINFEINKKDTYSSGAINITGVSDQYVDVDVQSNASDGQIISVGSISPSGTNGVGYIEMHPHDNYTNNNIEYIVTISYNNTSKSIMFVQQSC